MADLNGIDFAQVRKAFQYKQYDPETRKHAYSIQLADGRGKIISVLKCDSEEQMRERHTEIMRKILSEARN